MSATNTSDEIGEEEMRRLAEASGSLANKVRVHDWLLVGICVVVVVGFVVMLITVGGMVVSSLADKQATSQQIRDEVKSQNDKIDELTSKVNDLTKALQDEQKTIQKTN